ncbi:MtrAB system histidine kinase MtrB [Demequina sp.]|uniref:MtrAB system histidine kinase MtrB n=1 Tax=Demequina sp. TaxID=2050685 RepID=UPI003D0B4ED8
MSARKRSVGAAAAAQPRRFAGRWRRSLMFRVVVTTLVIGLGTVALLGAYVTSQIRDGLVETRVDRILQQSAQDVASAQADIDASPAEGPADLTQLVVDIAAKFSVAGGEDRYTVLIENPQNSSDVPIGTQAPNQEIVNVITPEMRDAVQEGVTQPWQFVALPDGTPAVTVGSTLDIRAAGEWELYFIYSLADEEQTLTLIQRVLGLGAGMLVALVVFMTWWVGQQAVRPVRDAARVASRLAEGRLSERMTVRGNDEMATLARTFNEMAESLQRQITRMEELSRLQRRFVSDVSHELRTPLTTVRMASDVLYDARQDFPPEVARSAELLSGQLDRFETLLADLLEISRIDAGAARLEFEDISVADVVRDEADAIAHAAANVGVEVRLWIAEGEHVASIDRPRVGRIVRNLLSNAVEHAQDHPVDVAVGSNGRAVAVVVRDYGIGLTAQQVDRVFDRFWRADAARARTMGGTGLGLSIAREDARLHGGKLEAWGRPGKGASFRLLLPRTSRGLGQDAPLPLAMRESEFEALGTAEGLAVRDDEEFTETSS